ncbi:hypothetical protein HF086_001462 [Spodoptera exigua]|uniref:Tick transposon n=1 Tax=Spodoptera exigua TaxID=7107 RepID=A0A922SFA8_SPOEX|nr:hypothetical protein HF086_001462 [Spodoptera exigua]
MNSLPLSLAMSQSKIESVENNILQTKSTQNGQSPFDVQQNLMLEFKDRCEREKNIIIAGIPETFDKKSTVRRNYDNEKIIELTTMLYENCPKHIKSMRLGKYDPNKSRLLKVYFDNNVTPKQLLKNKSKLPDNIRIYSDQTPSQKAFMESLKQELHNRKENGEENLIIKYNISYEITDNQYENNNHYLWIYLQKFDLNIGVIYKPGDTDVKAFLDTYAPQLERRRRTIVVGDFNIDLLGSENYVKQYLDTVQEEGYEIINKKDIDYCTRATANTKTILDHVCTNLTNKRFSISIIESSLSDHKHIYFELLKSEVRTNERVQYEALDYNNLLKCISEAQYENDNNLFSTLEDLIKTQISRNKITKTKILNPPQKDWINKNILDSINKRNILLHQRKTDIENLDIKNKFEEEREKVNTTIRNTKKEYYYKLFQENLKKPKKTWELINTLARNKVKDNCAPSKLIIGSNVITEGISICDAFNEYFSSIGSLLANQIDVKYHANTVNTLMYKSDHKHTTTLDEFAPCTVQEGEYPQN